MADALGLTPEGCVDRLALRPLLVGAAWKVLDLLYEEALHQRGITPDRGRQYSIAGKQLRARRGTARPEYFSRAAWDGLTALYANTTELRHSLVHRTVRTDAEQALVGVDRKGRQLRPLTVSEQEAFGKSALIASSMTGGSGDARDEMGLLSHLGVLVAVHRRQLGVAPTIPRVVPEITVRVGPCVADGSLYKLDIPAIRAWLPFPDARDSVDMIVTPRDRPGQELHGRLEDGPDGVFLLHPDDPPSWLH